MKVKYLYKNGVLLGIVPMAIGLMIFFVWWGARALYAIDLIYLTMYGFLWVLISIPIVGLGLILLVVFAIKNYPNFLKKSLLGFLVISVNIPIAGLVYLIVSDSYQKAYVKIYNKTEVVDFSEVQVKSAYFQKQIGGIDRSCSKVFNFYPKYVSESPGESFPQTEPVILVIKTENSEQPIELKLSRIGKGDCWELYIDKDFKIVNKWQWQRRKEKHE